MKIRKSQEISEHFYAQQYLLPTLLLSIWSKNSFILVIRILFEGQDISDSSQIHTVFVRHITLGLLYL